ncbi:MAG TPA: hypothetical protein VHT96_01815 [Clostridia bacterium]|nr:hypothetical protein [Clostridia bacterium]
MRILDGILGNASEVSVKKANENEFYRRLLSEGEQYEKAYKIIRANKNKVLKWYNSSHCDC